MRIRHLVPLTLLALGTAACNTGEILDVPPATAVDSEEAITDEVSARAAAAGMYDALQDGSYYGGNFFLFGDLLADNARHSGTFTSYREADLLTIQVDNSAVAAMWIRVYRGISRSNALIEKLPGVPGMDEDEKDQLLGEAYFLRALNLHNAVKLWGPVPIVSKLITSPTEAAEAERSPVAEVYTQIHADLTQAEQLIGDEGTRAGSLGAVRALRARVHLYQGNWAQAEAAANSVIAMGYELADDYASLNGPGGSDTPEDIFRIAFNDQDGSSISFYYLSKPAGGRFEVAPSNQALAMYESGDLRRVATFARTGTTDFVAKYGSGIAGTEHLHVIRFAEILLIKAEAQARLGRLAEALATVNPIRARAGLPALTLGTMTQAAVISAILRERRVELAFEGDRWPDLVRTGLAVSTLNIPTFRTLLPIPRAELDVSPKLVQNPGYEGS